MEINLGFLMGAFAPAIRAKVAEKMQKVFGGVNRRTAAAGTMSFHHGRRRGFRGN